jgi:tRNA(Met) cytidine acetyltransferase
MVVGAALDAGYGEVLCVAAGARPGGVEACKWVSAASIEKILGREFDAAIIVAPGFLAPNTVAAVAETVRGGGFLALVVPPLSYWAPGGSASTGAYREYLVKRIGEARALLWLDLELGRVLACRLPSTAPKRERAYLKSRSGVPRSLIEQAASDEQARALDEVAEALRKRARSVVILGDRGRGKSSLLGLIVAYLIVRHEVGFVPVTAPSVWNVQSFFHVLGLALSRLVDGRWWFIRRGEAVIGVAGPWFHVRYHTPDATEPGSYTVVDEAAAIGPLRLRRLVRRVTRLLVATTVHGYEGSGKVFTRMVVEQLPKPVHVVEVKEPIRYPRGDPLEEWLYRAFMLDAEAPQPPPRAESTYYYAPERKLLVEDYELLRSVYGILVQAHYRNEPNDLALMIDAPHHSVRVLRADGAVVAAAQLAHEDCQQPYEWRRLVDLLSFHSRRACETRGLRVVRIAVHPQLQRQGLGSALLKRIEEEARSKGYDWVGAVYGRVEVTPFWLSNGYQVVYVSPLPNRLTGEKNVAVAKPVSAKGASVVAEAALAHRLRLLLAASTTYRDLPAEVLTAMLKLKLPPARPPLEPTAEQLSRLERLARGELDVEATTDALLAAAVARTIELGFLPLDGAEAVAFVARVLQGKNLEDVASMLKLPAHEARAIVRRAATRIALAYVEGR